MKTTVGLIFSFIILCLLIACSEPPKTNNAPTPAPVKSPDPIANYVPNISNKERKNEENKASNVEKELDDLQKKVSNSDATNKNLHEALREAKKQIDNAEKKPE